MLAAQQRVVAAQQAQLAAVEARQIVNEGEVQQVRAEQKALGNAVAKQQEQQKQVQKQLRGLTGQVTKLSSRMDEKIDKMDGKLDEVLGALGLTRMRGGRTISGDAQDSACE
jgi:predicted  nucleic acid-binding Zn-ribbon protein